MVVSLAKAANVDGIICIAETGVLAQHLFRLSGRFHFIATTTDNQTYDTLSQAGQEVIRLPLRTADKYAQGRHAISVVFQSSSVSIGDLVVCAIGHDVYREEGNLVVLAEMEANTDEVAVSDLLKLTDGIQPKVLVATVAAACKISRAARRGNRVGAIFYAWRLVKCPIGKQATCSQSFSGP